MSTVFNHIEIVGDKVRLRPVKVSDARVAYRLVKDEAVLKWLAWDGPASEKEVRQTYKRWGEQMETGDYYPFAIERNDQPGLMGCIDIRFPRHPQQADIGYWLGAEFWNRGYMSDAIRLVSYFSFKYLEAARVYATVFVGNIASRRALEKNGFSLDGTMRSHVHKRGRWLDAWFFTLLRTEWEADSERFLPGHEEVVVKK
jgi:RimJ/RimL family protein N-acetyltransferase